MKNDDKSLKLLQTGAETFGAAIGGAIGLIGGPIGAIGGGALGVLISKGLNEFAERYLSNRQQARVGAAAGLTILGIQHNISAGLELRNDGFLESDDIDRSKAEELFEGILLKCKNEFEEKKISYIANIYKNVAFDSSVNPSNANQVLNSIQQFSYRQLCMLALIGQNNNNNFSLRSTDYRDNYNAVTNEIEFLLQDFLLLDRQGLVVRNDNAAMLDTADVAPGLLNLTTIGRDYFKLLSLETMPVSEFAFIGQIGCGGA